MAHHALELLAGLDGQPVPHVVTLADPQSLETLAIGSCGRAHFLAGRLDVAREWLERSLATAGAAYSGWKIGILGSLALVEAWTGRLERAQAQADEALGVAREVGLLVHPVTADAFLASSLVALERGQPRHAALALREGCLRAETNRRSPLSWVGRLLAAELLAAEGRADQAVAAIAEARRALGSPPPPVVDESLVALQCRLFRLDGHPEEAERLLRDQPSGASPIAFESVAAALALGQFDRARKRLDGVGWMDTGPTRTVEHQLLLAWLATAEGHDVEAGHHLREATETAAAYGLIEVLARGGPTVAGLLAERTEEAALRDQVRARAQETVAPAGHDLLDPLTDRELEILTYLPSRLTNAELAQQCYVSVNTIKTHMAHIYRKLDVVNRNEAITRARALVLL